MGKHCARLERAQALTRSEMELAACLGRPSASKNRASYFTEYMTMNYTHGMKTTARGLVLGYTMSPLSPEQSSGRALRPLQMRFLLTMMRITLNAIDLRSGYGVCPSLGHLSAKRSQSVLSSCHAVHGPVTTQDPCSPGLCGVRSFLSKTWSQGVAESCSSN